MEASTEDTKKGFAARVEVRVTVGEKTFRDAFYLSEALITDTKPADVGKLVQSRFHKTGLELLQVLYHERTVRNPRPTE